MGVYVRLRFRFEFQVRDLKLSTTLTPEQKRVIILFSSLLLPKLLGELAKIGDIFRKCLSNQNVFWMNLFSKFDTYFNKNVFDNF